MCYKEVHVHVLYHGLLPRVHPFFVDIIIKSDTSAIKLLYIEYLNINDAYILYVCTCIGQ